jgi:hypothetical protein
VPIVLKSSSLNLLETSGPLQACNGIPFAVKVDAGYLEAYRGIRLKKLRKTK